MSSTAGGTLDCTFLAVQRIPGLRCAAVEQPEPTGPLLRVMKPPHLEDYDRPADAYFAAIGSAAIEYVQAVDAGTMFEAEAKECTTETRNDAVAALLGTRAGASRLK